MSETVTVTVSHGLGKAEARRRLEDGLARSGGQLGPMIAVEAPAWDGDTVRFRMRVLGQAAETSIDVLEDTLRIEVSLPWLLARAVSRLLPAVRDGATRLLEKKP